MMKTASEIRAEDDKLISEMGEIEVFGCSRGKSIHVDNKRKGTLKKIRLNIKDKNAIEQAFLEMFKHKKISNKDARDFHISFHEVNGKKEFFCYSLASVISGLDFELTSVSPEHYPLD